MSQRNARCGAGRGLILAGCVLVAASAACAQPQSAPPSPPATSPSNATGPAGQATSSAAPAALPAWEVSTIKPAAPDARGSMLMFTADGIKITNVPLFTVAREGFGLEDDRIFGGPGWAKSAMVEIEAKVAPDDAPKLKTLSMDQRRNMLVALLQERCGLKYHHETREMAVYDLVVAKGGSKLQASKPDPPESEGKVRHMLMMHGRGHIESTGADVHGLTRILSQQLGRTVVDKTGLTGNFDYKLDWTPDDATPAMIKSGDARPGENASMQENAGPSLFTALEEQLGLKLESSKGPVDVVVIDQLEQPTAN